MGSDLEIVVSKETAEVGYDTGSCVFVELRLGQ